MTPATIPTITLTPTSGPVGISVNIIGSGFDPNAAAIINFDGNSVDTIPQTVIANSDGEFSATFKVPDSSSLGDDPVIASQGDNSASTTFKVTPTLFSSLSTKSQSNVSSFEAPGNKSNATIPIVNNNTLFDNAESDHTIRVENNSPTANTSSIMEAENTSTTPTSNKMNNTSVTDFTDNKINENHVSSTSSEINDTSNIKKSSEKNSPINPLKSNDQPAPVELPKDNDQSGDSLKMSLTNRYQMQR